MLERPDISEATILETLQQAYEIRAANIAFLPLGADLRTAVYRVDSVEGTAFFVKLRRGDFNEITVTLPQLLSGNGVKHIITPLPARTGRLHVPLEDFQVMVYPFVEGDNGYVVELSGEQWRELGAAFKRIHTIPVPPSLQQRVPCETYTRQWRERVKTFL